MLHAVVQIDFAGFETLPDLSVNPELVAIGVYTRRLSVRVERQQIGPQALGQRGLRAFGERSL